MSSPEANSLLSFALYGAANRLVRMHKPFLEPLNLTFPQYLVALELLTNGPRSVGALGGKLGMDTGTITPLVKRLDQAGLVTRQRDALDERKVLVTLTDTGEALRERVFAVPGLIETACKISSEKAEEIRQALDGVGRPA